MTTSRRKFETIDEYMCFSNKCSSISIKLRKLIRELARKPRTISYGMPTFKLNGNLVHFAEHKKHIGFYPMSIGH